MTKSSVSVLLLSSRGSWHHILMWCFCSNKDRMWPFYSSSTAQTDSQAGFVIIYRLCVFGNYDTMSFPKTHCYCLCCSCEKALCLYRLSLWKAKLWRHNCLLRAICQMTLARPAILAILEFSYRLQSYLPSAAVNRSQAVAVKARFLPSRN